MQSEKEEIIVRKEIIQKVQDMFSPMFEGIRMYNRLEHRIQRAMKVEEKMGGVPFKPLNKLTDQQIRLHKEICDLSAVLMWAYFEALPPLAMQADIELYDVKYIVRA